MMENENNMDSVNGSQTDGDTTYHYDKDSLQQQQNSPMYGEYSQYVGGYGNNSSINESNNSYTENVQTVGNSAENTSDKNAKKVRKAKTKKNGGFFKKAFALVLSAVVFGAIAGGVMYGVNYTANKINPIKTESVNIPTVSDNSSLLTQASVISSEVTGGMDVSAVANAALPAMVALQGTTTVQSSTYWGMFGQSYEAQTSGTGIIVGKNDTELLLLTNAHVVEDVNNLKCEFVDGKSVACTVKGAKTNKDIAVVAVNLSDIPSDTISKIAIAELGDSDDIAVGQEVVAIGNALGEGQSVTNGIISALNRSITVNNTTFEGLFMTNAAINSGNSGGALLDASGKVVGINFAKTSEDGVEGMAYAIPVSNVKDIIENLMTTQTRTKVSDSDASYLGIKAVDVTSAISQQYDFPQGVLIRSVVAGSPAENAGLAAYDVIYSFDGQTISSMTQLQNLMKYYKAGEKVTVEYYHLDGDKYVSQQVDVTLGNANSAGITNN